MRVFLILHNIRSGYNVGSIFRTANGAGVKKIFLTGYTPKPINEFGKTRREIHKTALGAEKMIEWEYHRDIGKLIKKLKKKLKENKLKEKGNKFKKRDKKPLSNFCHGKIWATVSISVIGLEQSEKAVDYRKFKPKFPLVLIVGNEVRGLSEKILKKCDAVIQIPMRGKKESLNVSVAAAIAIYEILK